ncbi:uncharacterized protein LOC105644113 isoform X2 [Jatropha curcas]|uniref:uncharacterized protein LOC105644113 isoform X2 n=1 Tax=Jatropha curcas TaxID=180498 RepID=UPI0005FB7E21|nr:uncharacterized protein LOC105644113 isoform X2 [Jatropha curcas]
MGTKVQHKMYLSGYYPMKDLNDSNGNGNWPSHHENKTFGQCYGLLSAKPATDGYIANEKEQLRQTIMKHETVFRQQKQADMMNEVTKREPHKHFKPMETSQSSFFAFPSVDDKSRCYSSSLPLVDFSHRMQSPSGADSIQSHFSSMDVKIMQSGYGSTLNGSRSKECESLEFKCKKLQRRLFDLERPAEEYINGEDEGQGASGGSGMENCPPHRNCELACEKNGNLSTRSCAYSMCNGDASSSNMNLKRKMTITDLNEPVQVGEASGTDSVDILGNITCSREGLRNIDLSASNCSGFLAKEASRTPLKVKDEGGVCSLHSENEKRQRRWLPSPCNSGQTTSNINFQTGGFQCEYLPAICESSQVGYQKPHELNQNRREVSTRKTIFGVEISVRNHDTSVIPSSTRTSQPLVPQSNVANSESSSISSWKNPPAGWRPNLIFFQGNPCLNTFPKSEVDGLLINNNVRSFPSLKAETSCQNSPRLLSQLESKESQVCHGFSCINGISDSNSTSEKVPQHSPANNFRSSGILGISKSIEEANPALPKSCKNEAVSVDGPKEENPKGGFSWLRDISFCNGKYFKESNGYHNVNLDFFQNHSEQFTIKTETMKSPFQSFTQNSLLMINSDAQDAKDKKTEGADCSSNLKVLGIPICEKQMSKDLPSSTFASNPSFASEIDGANYVKPGILLTDLNHYPIPSESGEIQHLKCVNEGDASLRDCFDLNVCVAEEEAQSTHVYPRTEVKVAIEIDLEAPVVLGNEIDISSGGEFVESELKEPVDSLNNESGIFHEGFMKVAAEALIAISSSGIHNIQDDATCHQVEASLSDSLHWFAEIITSYNVEIENNGMSASVGKDSTDCQDTIPNGIDYFEYMTLNLTETKLKEYHYESEVIDNTKDEVTLLRRPRRGQARRGRQRKDFQRDILPSLSSLSRNDVANDLQTIEGLIRATGGIWQSSLSQRNSPKGKRGRGRRSAAASATSPTENTVCSLQTQQPKCAELGLEETGLTGWGKRTRRLPRHRCPINHPTLTIQ